jgi:hypothetical protein
MELLHRHAVCALTALDLDDVTPLTLEPSAINRMRTTGIPNPHTLHLVLPFFAVRHTWLPSVVMRDNGVSHLVNDDLLSLCIARAIKQRTRKRHHFTSMVDLSQRPRHPIVEFNGVSRRIPLR